MIREPATRAAAVDDEHVTPPAEQLGTQERTAPSIARAVYWLGWLAPVALAGHYVDFRTLDVRRGHDLLMGDWTTYIAAPNFLRGAPIWTFPVGEIPNYLAPIGTSLGQTDSFPVLTPLYRLLLAIFPGDLVQLVGPLLFVALVATFGVTRYFARGRIRTRYGGVNLPGEVAAIAIAMMLVAQPFFLTRMGHVALMHQWVIVLAIVLALSELERDRITPLDWRPLAVVAAAGALEPYLLAMVIPIVIAPMIRPSPRGSYVSWLRGLALRVLGCGVVAVVVSVVLGYVVIGASTENAGFGLYPSNVMFLVDPDNWSRLLGDLPTRGSAEGNGYVGLAMLCVIALAGVIAVRRRGQAGPSAGRLWPVMLVCVLLAVFALLPIVWLGNSTALLDARPLLNQVDALTGTLRTNGRFVWPLIWLVGLSVVGVLIRRLPINAVAAIAIAGLALQVVETAPSEHIRPNRGYDEVVGTFRQAIAAGASGVEVQPPWVTYECSPPEWTSFDALRNVVAASAFLGLPINSGYAGRGSDEVQAEICQRQASEFAAHRYLEDVLYVIPPPVDVVVPGLECVALPESQRACMAAGVPGWPAP